MNILCGETATRRKPRWPPQQSGADINSPVCVNPQPASAVMVLSDGDSDIDNLIEDVLEHAASTAPSIDDDGDFPTATGRGFSSAAGTSGMQSGQLRMCSKRASL